MRWNKVFALMRKELRDITRDKKTMFVMYGMPLILYPLMFFLIFSIISRVESEAEADNYVIACSENVDTQIIDEYLLNKSNETDYSYTLIKVDDFETAIVNAEADACIDYKDDQFIVHYNSASNHSSNAYKFVNSDLSAYKEDQKKEILAANGIDAEKMEALNSVTQVDYATGEDTMGSILGMIVPLLLIMGVMISAMNLGMDQTTGEKERGTQETLMSLPMTGTELIAGKFLAVSLMSMLSAVLYFISVAILGGYMLIFFGDEIGTISLGAYVPSLVVILLSIVAFSLFMSALIMAVSSFAKTTKEASSFTSPIMFVVLIISYAGYLDLHLNMGLSLVPILNIVLMIKNVMQFEFNYVAIMVVLFSNVLYATIAIMILGKLYNSEAILFGEGKSSIIERKPAAEKGSTPSIGDIILVLCVTLILFVYVGAMLATKNVTLAQIFIPIIVGGVGLIAAWYGRIDIKHTYSFKKPSVLQCTGAIVMGIGCYFGGTQILQLIAPLLGDSLVQYSDAINSLMGDWPFWVAFLLIAVAPAICEELLFRGYMLGGLKDKLKPIWVIIITALTFGLYHMNVPQGIYATLLGCVLAWVTLKTQSIIPAMLMHFTANLISVGAAYLVQAIMSDSGEMAMEITELAEASSNPFTLLFQVIYLVVGVGIAVVGGIMIAFSTRKK